MAVETLEEERSCEGSSEASEEHSEEEEEEKGEQVPRTVLARTRRSLAQQQLETSSSSHFQGYLVTISGAWMAPVRSTNARIIVWTRTKTGTSL